MHRREVLLVEDDAQLAAILGDVLQAEGYRVKAVRDGIAGIEALGTSLPDVILLDLNLPRMNGWQFCAELETRQIHPPIVIMTAGVGALPQAAGHLSKPFDVDDLLRLLDAVTRQEPA